MLVYSRRREIKFGARTIFERGKNILATLAIAIRREKAGYFWPNTPNLSKLAFYLIAPHRKLSSQCGINLFFSIILSISQHLSSRSSDKLYIYL